MRGYRACHQGIQEVERELHWLPKLAPSLSLRVPGQVAQGHPARDYPFPWAIYGWIDGQPFRDDLVHDERQAAADLAQFVVELRRMESPQRTARWRKPLRELDAATRAAIEASRGVIDSDAAAAAWEMALETPL